MIVVIVKVMINMKVVVSMKDPQIQEQLRKATKGFLNGKRKRPAEFLNEVVAAMLPAGGITGFSVSSNQTMTLRNHNAWYCLPVRYEEHTQRLSAQGRRAYEFLELFIEYMGSQGVDKSQIEYHLGKGYSSKHHQPAAN